MKVRGATVAYAAVTIAYWSFMLTDGALRMLVLLHFHGLGFSPVQLAYLFMLYEVAGIVTNGGVASTVRDAHLRNIHTILLSDGCAAFDPNVHEATLISLGSITPIATCADMIGALS